MKLISWNIRGCSNPRKWKAINHKLKHESLDILFLQETKCSFGGLAKIKDKIWKGNQVMAIDAAGQSGGIAILWQPRSVEFSNCRANKFTLMAYFCFLDSGVRGTAGNIYGPSCFHEKHSFMGFLNWLQEQAEQGPWVLGGNFNLIANLGEKKGGRRTLDKFQKAFSEFIAQGPLVDMEMGSGCFMWNNKRGGEHLVASCLDRFLVSENVLHSTREILADVLPAAGLDHWPIRLSWD